MEQRIYTTVADLVAQSVLPVLDGLEDFDLDGFVTALKEKDVIREVPGGYTMDADSAEDNEAQETFWALASMF